MTSTASMPARVAAPPQRAAPDDPGRSRFAGDGRFDGLQWTFRGGFDQVLARVPRKMWEDPAAQGWRRIKENDKREVWRAEIAGGVYYLKYYARDGWSNHLRRLIGRAACEAEWNSGTFALQAGIPAVIPAGLTRSLRRADGNFALLVTVAVEPAYPLGEMFLRVLKDENADRRRKDIAQLAELLGEMIARAHQAGFEHLDMHAANILAEPVAPGKYRTLFVDLHSARLGVPLRMPAAVRNLSQLNQWFRRYSSVKDRLRFLRAYLRWRNEYETSFPQGQPLGGTLRELVGALKRAADRHAQRLWSRRDRRAQRSGRYYARLRLSNGWRARVYLQTKHPTGESRASHLAMSRQWWAEQLAQPARWLAQDASASCKDSHSAQVRRALLSHPDGELPVIIKRPQARNWRRRVRQWLFPSRAVRGWERGHALLNRDLPTARPLACLERKVGPFVRDALLITEAVPGAVDVEAYLRGIHANRRPAEYACRKHRLTRQLATLLRRFEERGFAHRDCKAGNILVLEQPVLRLFWVDMDGVRRSARGYQRPIRALARLYASLDSVPGVTRTDCARLLKHYTARWGTDMLAWRKLWRELEPAVANSLAATARHRAWKRANYGRE